MKKLLVTGGAGFIGSNFIQLLLEEHPSVQLVNLDNLTYAGNLSTLSFAENHPQYTFVKGDIADGNLIESLFQEHQFDHVVNFAAESHVDRSIEDPGVFIRTNVLGVQVLLEACRRHQTGRYLQVSTDEVYGSLGETGLFTEDLPLDPSSPYSSSKASADLLVQAWHRTYGLNVGITRCSNNYGPNQFPEKLIPLMISKALADEALPVYGDGSNVRDWIHVEDHCRGILTVLERGVSGRIYNIGGKSERDNLTVVKRILNILGKPESLISFVTDRLGHDWRYAIDNSRIASELNWEPRHTFETGLEQTVQWYLDNEHWWRPLQK
ncbi:MAG: dTDP-glucose 4,6-dehydratase [Proteobacteria bacterium]|nr:dTDP-glucose 4,6-dehydratase [Pseudomonadota bacterium]